MADPKQNTQQAAAAAQGGKPARKKVRKNVLDAIAHVHASFNNTIITITDRQGNTLSWATAGGRGLARLRQRPPVAGPGGVGRSKVDSGAFESPEVHGRARRARGFCRDERLQADREQV